MDENKVKLHFSMSNRLNLYHRSSRWWEYVVLQSFQDHDWKQNFRMSKRTFDYLCNQVGPLLQHQDTRIRKAIPVPKRVAITLWCMATCSEYRTVGHLFGVARCTVCHCP